MNTPLLLLPILAAVLVPLPSEEDYEPPVDCECAFNGNYSTTVPTNTNPHSSPDVTIDFTDESQSGRCDGLTNPCPTVGACHGTATMHVSAKPFTQFALWPNPQFMVNNLTTYDWQVPVTGCGFSASKKLEVYARPNGNSLGNVTLRVFCTRCSDS
jgi:hypothetical protein